MNIDLSAMLELLSSLMTPAILIVAGVHVFLFFILYLIYRSSLRRMASSLDDFTRNLRHRSILDRSAHLSDQIESFLEDVREVLALPAGSPDRLVLRDRINVLDEKRKFAQSLKFETFYNLCRTMIEAYPLAGVLGTVLAIGAALNTGDGEGAATVGVIVSRFGEAIWSTFAGLICAIVLMFINSLLEPPFERLRENRTHARETVARAKRELALISPVQQPQTSPIQQPQVSAVSTAKPPVQVEAKVAPEPDASSMSEADPS